MSKFPTIEEIAEGLTSDLAERGFVSVTPSSPELLRYEKKENSAGFQVRIEEDSAPEEEPEFNHIYLVLGYNLPEGTN